jgi:hypothetical protein
MINLLFIEIYILGFIATLNWIFTWQTTTLKCKFLKIWLCLRRRKVMIYTPTDFEEYVYKNWGILGELLTCPICFCHWVGAIFSGILCYYLNGPVYLPIVSFFTYPVLVYFLIKKYI